MKSTKARKAQPRTRASRKSGTTLREQLEAERIRRLRIESEMLAARGERDRAREAHDAAETEAQEERTKAERLQAELHNAWVIIANAGGGDWERERPDWQAAAHKWGVENGFRAEPLRPDQTEPEPWTALENVAPYSTPARVHVQGAPQTAIEAATEHTPETSLAFLTALPTETPDPDEDEKRRALLARTRALARDWPATGKWTDLPPTEMECHALRAAILGAPAREDAAPGYAREVRP